MVIKMKWIRVECNDKVYDEIKTVIKDNKEDSTIRWKGGRLKRGKIFTAIDSRLVDEKNFPLRKYEDLQTMVLLCVLFSMLLAIALGISTILNIINEVF
jgi:hypothetical protein